MEIMCTKHGKQTGVRVQEYVDGWKTYWQCLRCLEEGW